MRFYQLCLLLALVPSSAQQPRMLRGAPESQEVSQVISNVLHVDIVEDSPSVICQDVPGELKFRFTWETCSQSKQANDLCNVHEEENDIPCNLCQQKFAFLNPKMDKPVYIQVRDAAAGSKVHYFDGEVYVGGEFTISLSKSQPALQMYLADRDTENEDTVNDEKDPDVILGSALKFYVFSEAPSYLDNEIDGNSHPRTDPSLVQEVTVPISRSADEAAPLSTCDTFGSLMLVGFENDKQGKVENACPHPHGQE